MSAILSLTIPLAFILDLFLGDPQRLPHPIRWMGQAIERWEPFFRSRKIPPVRSGLAFAAFLVTVSWCLAFGLVESATLICPWAGVLVEILLIYYCLATRSLYDAAVAVGRELCSQDLAGARRRVAMIVGRETDGLDDEGVGRAAVETVAENLVDGVIAPLFFAVIGGGPLALAYKMVNTLDSMVGYKNERYLEFGRAAARLDDIANWFPARLSVPVIALAATCLNGRGWAVLRMARRDGRNHSSPNAGLSEAAFAGALKVRLGGPNRYHGRRVEKPWIGAEFSPVRNADIFRACDLMLAAAVLSLAAFWGLPWIISLLF